MKKQYTYPIISTVGLCLSLGVSAGDLTSLRFEKTLLKAGTKTTALMGYLSKEGQRLTPESCVVIKGSPSVSVQVASGGCMVYFSDENGGYAKVQAELHGEKSSFTVFSSDYEFEHPFYTLSYGESVYNELSHNGQPFAPDSCEALDNDAGTTGLFANGCLFVAGTVDASDTILAFGRDSEVPLSAFEVVVGTGSGSGYQFEDAEQHIAVDETKNNTLTLNGSEVAPDVCIAENSDVVATGLIVGGNGCFAKGKAEGTTRITAYNIISGVAQAVSDYQVVVENSVDDQYICDDSEFSAVGNCVKAKRLKSGAIITSMPSKYFTEHTLKTEGNFTQNHNDWYLADSGLGIDFLITSWHPASGGTDINHSTVHNLCEAYNRMKLAGRANWQAVPYSDETHNAPYYEQLFNEYGNMSQYGWPTGYFYGIEDEKNNLKVSSIDLKDGVNHISSRADILYSSCISIN